MPIGVPRVIYCWGEELPAQWTDIYNFIFRRRMIFLMQYLDDELCNQICGLLINIHMEDRGKELQKKDMEASGIFKGPTSNTSPNPSKGGVTEVGSGESSKNDGTTKSSNTGYAAQKRKSGSSTKATVEDLLTSEEDLAIDENYILEQYTLQKITKDWLNWNAQFFNYSDEPYLFYLAELLSKDFNKDKGNLFYKLAKAKTEKNDLSKFMRMFKNTNDMFKGGREATPTSLSSTKGGRLALGGMHVQQEKSVSSLLPSQSGNTEKNEARSNFLTKNSVKQNQFNVYTPFRLIANFAAKDYSLKSLMPSLSKNNFLKTKTDNNAKEGSGTDLKQNQILNQLTMQSKLSNTTAVLKDGTTSLLSPLPNTSSPTIVPPPLVGVGVASFCEAKGKHVGGTEINNKVSNLTWTTTLKNFKSKTTNPKNLLEISEKALGQRHLRKQYTGENFSNNLTNNTAFSKPSFEGVSKGINNKVSNLTKNKKTPLSYLEFENKKNPIKGENSANVREYYRKQNERIIRAEEEKKVFVIINSFGGSVGNGITVHDALQFIKAGSLTLGLGVAASASSLVLAGGTITERFVTEGCHTMIHQPEGGLNGQASDIWIDSHEIMKIRLDVAEIYSLSAQRPRHKILRDLDRDFYLTANETIAYGLADEIATNEVMHEIIEMTRRVWDYQDVKQQRLLEARNTGGDGLNTQTQN